jgi:hypothetical protein
MADFVVGASIQTNTYNLVNSGINSSTTVPFSGINSYDFTGLTPGSNASYVPAFGRVCWGLNDFTLEAFVRGDGSTIEGNIFFLPVNSGGSINEYGRNMVCGLNSSDQIYIKNTFRNNDNFTVGEILIDIDTPDSSTWYHLAITRKNNKFYVLWNGERVAYDIDSAGNGSFLDGGSVSNIGSLGFLFKPFGGLTTGYSLQLIEFVLGGTGNYPNIDGYIANFRSSYIAQYDVTQTTYTVPSAAFTGAESGTDYYAKTFSGPGSGFNNAGTALPRGGIQGEVVNELVLENLAVGSVTTVEENNVNYPIELDTYFAGITLGEVAAVEEILVQLTGISLTSSLSSVGAGLGILVPVTQLTANTGLGILVPVTQLTANTNLGSVKIPTVWSKIQTGTTTNWTEVDTG